MRTTVLFIIALVMLLSCEPPDRSPRMSPDEAMAWTRKNISFVTDQADATWQKPRKTIELGTGDCEDVATLIVWLVGRGEVRGYVGTARGGHAAAYIDGKFFDPTWPEFAGDGDLVFVLSSWIILRW